jgi:hypothetical protein
MTLKVKSIEQPSHLKGSIYRTPSFTKSLASSSPSSSCGRHMAANASLILPITLTAEESSRLLLLLLDGN